jgi:putative membrane protein
VTAKDESTPERTLVLCVDRDDDIGVKAGVKTPILGREENINAAVKLGLKDPEESDTNAIFEAIRIYDRLKQSAPGKHPREECQIATISGSELGDVGSDKLLVSELTAVLKSFPASEVILVSDGFSDEAVLPLVQSRVPVTSVRRVTVRHSESIEETMWIFSRYMKILFENPKYARMILGLPGLLLIVLGILTILNMASYSWIAFLVVLGSYLAVKGFMLDKAVRHLYVWIREFSPPPFPISIANFAAVAGFLLMAVGSYQGFYQASAFVSGVQPPPAYLNEWIAIFPQIIGNFLSQAAFLFVVGISTLLLGRVIRWFFERDSRLLRTIDIVVVVIWSSQIFNQVSRILINPALPYDTLIFATGIGIVLAVASVLVTTLLNRIYADYFREKEENVEESENRPQSAEMDKKTT